MSAVAPGARALAVAEVIRTVEDYFLGWYDADSERMVRALHPDLAKRGHRVDAAALEAIDETTATEMVAAAGAGRGRRTVPAERRFRVIVDEVFDTIATVRVESVPYREYLQLVRTAGGWRIVNALWTWTDDDRRSR